jgi:hypothetical protein
LQEKVNIPLTREALSAIFVMYCWHHRLSAGIYQRSVGKNMIEARPVWQKPAVHGGGMMESQSNVGALTFAAYLAGKHGLNVC